MADTLDILTDAEAREAIRNSAASVTGLDVMVTAVSRIIDDACGPVVQRTVTAELHPGGSRSVLLRRRPVASVTLVREAQSAGNVETLDAVAWGAAGDGYHAPVWDRDPSLLSGVVRRKSAGADTEWWPGSESVEVTYVAGRYANTAAVDERFKAAAGSVLRRLWKREAGAWAQAPGFLEQNDGTSPSGFYRAVMPIVEELLHDELQADPAGFA